MKEPSARGSRQVRLSSSQLILHRVNCLITCIALNLYLITCLGVNPLQLRLERWYVAGSLFFGLGLPIIPAALGHLGRDPLYGIW
jgi:hypothetical protein